MIKKKIGVDEQKAFEETCRINGIEITPYDSNKNPVAYIDQTGKTKILKRTKRKVSKPRDESEYEFRRYQQRKSDNYIKTRKTKKRKSSRKKVSVAK